jgi:hypothetical protein
MPRIRWWVFVVLYRLRYSGRLRKKLEWVLMELDRRKNREWQPLRSRQKRLIFDIVVREEWMRLKGRGPTQGQLATAREWAMQYKVGREYKSPYRYMVGLAWFYGLNGNTNETRATSACA